MTLTMCFLLYHVTVWIHVYLLCYHTIGFPGGLENLPAMQETQVQFLGQEDPLEKEMATTSVFLPGESRGLRSLAGYSLWGLQRVEHD